MKETNMEIKLYTTHCPRCSVIEKKLAAAHISYTEVSDERAIGARGIDVVPVLEIDGKLYSFGNAIKWIHDYEEESH